MMRRGNSFLPLLDVISCALGAGVLLAVIFSIIEVPIPAPKSDNFIAVELWSEFEDESWGILAQHRELNLIKFIVPEPVVLDELNNRDLQLNSRGALEYLAWHGEGFSVKGGSRVKTSLTTIVISQPVEGRWLITPFLYDMGEGEVGAENRKGTVSFRWKTKKQEVVNCTCMLDSPAPGNLCSGELTEEAYTPLDDGPKLQCKDETSFIQTEI